METHKNTLKNNFIPKMKKYIWLSQMEKYIKTSENQDLNDLLLKTLAWIDYRRWCWIPNKKLSLLPKICRF